MLTMTADADPIFLAREVVAEVLKDEAEGRFRLSDLQGWADLHDYVDANDYVAHLVDWSAESDEAMFGLATKVEGMVEAILWPARAVFTIQVWSDSEACWLPGRRFRSLLVALQIAERDHGTCQIVGHGGRVLAGPVQPERAPRSLR